MGQLLYCWNHPQSISGARQLHGYAVAPVVALQAQGLATQGRSLSTPAPLRALRPRTPDPAWSWPVVGEGIVSGKFSKSRGGGWSWYAGDFAVTGSFGEDAHHDQEAR